jgi:type II secretory pathway pseudopilin PulG
LKRENDACYDVVSDDFSEHRMGDSDVSDRQKQSCCAAAPRRADRGAAGFSLAEALIAIVIAALLATALMRVANTTRMNAGRIQDLVNSMGFAETLLAQVAPRALGAEQGRTGGFLWQVSVAPVNITTIAHQMSKNDDDDDADSKKAPGLPALFDDSTQADKQKPVEEKLPVSVTITVNSPSGRRYSIDTLGIVPAPRSNEQDR